ncbi:Multiple RNA-binding domain-containing protein 1 [Pseudozyma hubeiensis]|nr:Multiple RNA-binding domain-containing protein 1 [Pseudozyma hubeiensis]
MSRLIVRGLPSYLTDARLREHFSQKGAVTDVKLMRRPDGTSRKFGFVGYRSDDEAQQALDYFNRTFIDTSRISVELAKKIGDEELTQQREERRNKRNAAASQEASTSTSTSDARKRKADKSDPKQEDGSGKKKSKKGGAISFEEFMSVMQPKAKRKAWQNEDAPPEQTMQDIVAPEHAIEKKAARKAQKKADAQAAAVSAAEAETTAQQDSPSESTPEPDAAANDVGLTDEEYMRLRMKHKVGTDLDTLQESSSAPQFEQSDDEKDDAEAAAADSDFDAEDEQVKDEDFERKQAQMQRNAQLAAEKNQKLIDQIMDSGRLFIRNLPFAANEDDIQSFFESFGTVKQVHIPLDKQTKASKGLAFVSFSDPSHALAAYRAKDGSTFQGRLLHLLPAVNKDAPAEAADSKKSATLKQARAEQKKQDAAKDFNWSMLYMSSDAVASSIADRLGVSKSDILNPGADGGADNAAVRLALAETRIIQETKEFFSQEGIDVDAFDGKGARSDTTILVKNIPYGTSVEEVEKLFADHGEVDKVLIPPSGTIAIVEMPVVSEARVAFRSIAYKRFKGGILYLEKAPVGLLTPNAGEKNVKQAPIVGKSIETSNPASNLDNAEAAVDGATLYIKNLSFSTTDERLASAFSGLSDFAFARIQTKPDPRRPGARLSMGYGFVGFKSVDGAQKAQKAMDAKVIDGHTLVVTFARRNAESSTTVSNSSSGSTKILIKNLPFEATKRDIRQLFSSQGQLKSVRLPKKFDNTTRGFGFVEYTTVREAQSAMEALKHTHLLGRHLVLQWSKVGESSEEQVEMQRSKTKQHFVNDGDAAGMGGDKGKRAKIKLNSAQISDAVKKAKQKRDDVEDDE